MAKDNVVAFNKPAFEDALTELLRVGARRLIREAVELELAQFLGAQAPLEDGRACVVRNGLQREREVLTGLGPIPIRMPKTRDRSAQGRSFRSSLVPPYVRKAASVEAVLPWLYLAGIGSDHMGLALHALLGENAKGLSDSSISRLKEKWADELDHFSRQDLSRDEWVYLWADGVYTNLRGDDDRLCALVVIGVNARGQKHLLSLRAGVRESEASWSEVLIDLRERGLNGPKLLTGDGGQGLWLALKKTYPKTPAQRCWVHKTANVLNKLPKAKQRDAKHHLHAIWQAENKAQAEKEMRRFEKIYRDKYPNAVDCLIKDQHTLLTFYDFPAAHWKSIRTSNPIESTFASVRHRSKQCKGAFTQTSAMTLIFKLIQAAEKRWRKIDGFEYIAKIITGTRFQDGIEISHTPPNPTQSLAA